MAAPVEVQFQVGGIARVQEAFRTIEQITIRAEKAIAKLGAAGTKTREREYRTRAKTHEKTEQDSVKATARAEQDKVKAAEKAAKERVRNWIKSDKMIVAANKEAAREFDRIEGEKNRRANIWLKKREREELESARRTMRARENFARVTVGAAGRGLNVGMRAATQATMGVAGSMLSLGGGFSISDSVHRATAASGMAADIANSGFLPGGSVAANRTKKSTGQILGATRAAAAEYGLTNEDSLAGLQKFTGISGNLDAGMKMLPKLAQVARATGTSLDDLAEAAGNISLNLGDDDPTGETTVAIIRKLAEGGKLGAVEMRDFAAQLAKVTASAGQFKGGAAENIVKLGALAQEARGEGGAFSASVAANSVSGFTTTLKTGARAAALKHYGVEIYADPDKKTTFRAPEEIIFDAVKASKGDSSKLNEMFKNIMGNRLVQGFTNRYNKAGGGEAGEKAMRGRMNELLGNTSNADLEKQFAKDASDRMQESDAKMAQVMANFDAAVAGKLVPKLMELMPVIEKLIPQFVDLAARGVPAFVRLIKAVGDFADANKGIIQSLAEHPIGSIIAFEVAKSIGEAAIGEGLKGILTKVIAGATPGGGGAALTLSAGAVTIYTTKKVIDSVLENQVQGQQHVGALLSDISHLNELPPEKRKARIAAIQSEIANAKKEGGTELHKFDPAAVLIDTVASAITGDKKGIFGSTESIAKGAANDDLIKNADRLTAALGRAADAAEAHANADPNAPNRTQPLTVPRN